MPIVVVEGVKAPCFFHIRIVISSIKTFRVLRKILIVQKNDDQIGLSIRKIFLKNAFILLSWLVQKTMRKFDT